MPRFPKLMLLSFALLGSIPVNAQDSAPSNASAQEQPAPQETTEPKPTSPETKAEAPNENNATPAQEQPPALTPAKVGAKPSKPTAPVADSRKASQHGTDDLDKTLATFENPEALKNLVREKLGLKKIPRKTMNGLSGLMLALAAFYRPGLAQAL